jgi:hypothetical protein
MRTTNQNDVIFRKFDHITNRIRMPLLEKYSAKMIWNTIADAKRELHHLAPSIPDIGKKNIWQFNLDVGIMTLALQRSLYHQGFSLGECLTIIDDIFESYIRSFPKVLLSCYRLYYFSIVNKNLTKKSSVVSTKHRYSEDRTFHYLGGDGGTFNMGVNITECAIVKYYQKQHAEELIPCLCKLDHAMGQRLGLGFWRSGTLTIGPAVCDNRWTQGGSIMPWKD